MRKIRDYFNSFSGVKWFFFIILAFLIVAAFEQQVTRLYWRIGVKSGFIVPVVFMGEPKIRILNKDKAVRPGDVLLWEITFDKRMKQPPVDISCQIINHIIVSVPVDVPPEKPLGIRTCAYPFPMPMSIEYGKATMRRTYTYELGPEKIRWFTTIESEPFYTIPNAEPVLLQGEKGDKGDRGLRGMRGMQGIQGPPGKPDAELIRRLDMLDKRMRDGGWVKAKESGK